MYNFVVMFCLSFSRTRAWVCVCVCVFRLKFAFCTFHINRYLKVNLHQKCVFCISIGYAECDCIIQNVSYVHKSCNSGHSVTGVTWSCVAWSRVSQPLWNYGYWDFKNDLLIIKIFCWTSACVIQFSLQWLFQVVICSLEMHLDFVKLTPIQLTWRIWWAPNNCSHWQMGFNFAFKGIRT